jgi:hypothetical protein
MSRTWSGVLARLGVPTGDGRIIAPGSGGSRDLPLPLLYQGRTEDGHGGSVVVGRIETLTIGDGMVTATGSMLDAAYGTDVTELLEAGVIGPSVDLDDVEYQMDDQERIVITRWRIAGATLVAIPAFADVRVTLDPWPAAPMDEVELVGRAATDMDPDWMYASAAPEVLPPLDWFRQPDLDRLTPLTISDSGRVFGHIAGWETCHVGLPGCVTAPPSPSGYSYFHVAEQRMAEGMTLPVGTLVAGPTHCRDMQAGFQAAQQHYYDDPEAAVARVTAGEDEHGIWVAGWVLPGATEAAKAVFRSSPVSGDWRRVGGALELIAVCSVNAPGFPVPRARVSFSSLGGHSQGVQLSLVASTGAVPVAGEYTGRGTVGDDQRIARAKWAWAKATTGMES